VVAGVVVIVVAASELALDAAIAGGTAIAGSLMLAAIAGTVLGAELAGNEDLVKYVDNNEALQWARIAGTLMTLPDMAVGGVQALRDIGKLPSEISEATTLSHAAAEAAEAQRARLAKYPTPPSVPPPSRDTCTEPNGSRMKQRRRSRSRMKRPGSRGRPGSARPDRSSRCRRAHR
jgi:hypothetical protein